MVTVTMCFQAWRTWKPPLVFCLKAQFFQCGSGNRNLMRGRQQFRVETTDGFGMGLGTVTSGPSIGGRWERWMCKRTTATKPTQNKTQQNHSKTSQENYLRISWSSSCWEWLRTKLHTFSVSSQWDAACSRCSSPDEPQWSSEDISWNMPSCKKNWLE